MALFGDFLGDFLVALFLGVLGGLAAELITNKGKIEFPHRPKENEGVTDGDGDENNDDDKTHFFDLGVLSNLFLGGMAALAYFFVLDTTDPYKFVGATVAAGVGGSSVLAAIKQKLTADDAKGDLEEAANDLEIIEEQLGQVEPAVRTRGGQSNVPENSIEAIRLYAHKKSKRFKKKV
jgi:hypothetical protein